MKTSAADYMGVGLLCDAQRHVGQSSGMVRSLAARKARDSQVKTPPEKVNRARLAEIAGPKLIEDAIHLIQHTPEAMGSLRVVSAMHTIFRKQDRFLDLVGLEKLLRMTDQGPWR